MQLEEIRKRLLDGGQLSLDEERFFITSIRRGHAAALETRATSVRKAADKPAAKRAAGRGLDDDKLHNLLDGL